MVVYDSTAPIASIEEPGWMLSMMRYLLLQALVIVFSQQALGQQVGTELIHAGMMTIVENRLDRAGVILSNNRKKAVGELLRQGADRIYLENALRDAAPRTATFADRIVEAVMRRRSSASSDLEESVASFIEQICPSYPFC